jgi:hypothetical protein
VDPIIIAIISFIAVFLIFFIISLLSDIVIIGIVLASAVFTYFIPDLYPNIQEFATDMAWLKSIGVDLTQELNNKTHYILASLIVLASALFCIPILPFSATYRQMLGANKISGQDKKEVASLVDDKIDVAIEEKLGKLTLEKS